jgi:hypothetical protein
MYTLHVSPRKVTLILLALVTGLLLGGVSTKYIKYVHGHDLGLVRLFDLEGEGNLPSWYSSFLLLLSSALLGIIGLNRKREANPYGWHWLALALIFLYLSMDEGAGIHEMANPLIRRWLKTTGYLDSVLRVIRPVWLLAGIPFAVIVFLVFWRFLLHLPIATRAQFLIAGGLYIGGAIGVEAVAGHYYALHGRHTLTYQILVAFEDGLEMVGLVVFLYALLLYMATRGIRFQVVVNTDPPSPVSPVKTVDERDRGQLAGTV